ncbi:MAG: transglutaminase-like domain-containing protein [Anaerolineales bacterium]|jgi:hypothetical protein
MNTFIPTRQALVSKPRLSWQSVSFFILLFILFNSMIVGVTGVIKGLTADLVRPVVLVAMMLSWLLSRFRAKRWLIFSLTLLTGFILVFTAVGNLWNDWGEIFRWVTYYITATFRAILHNLNYPSAGPIVFALTQLADKMEILLERLWSWFLTLPRPSTDVFATGLVWTLAMWFMTIWATWFTHRRTEPLWGALPIIILVGVLQASTHSPDSIMLTILGATLALLVIVSQNRREQYWGEKRVGFSHVIQRNSTWTAIILSLLLVISADIISSIDFDDLIDRLREPEFSSTGEIDQENPIRYQQSDEILGIVDEFQKNVSAGLPNGKLIGSGPELSQQVMMHVTLQEVDPDTGNHIPVDVDDIPYFRALTYEDYSRLGWRANITKIYGYDRSLSLIKTYTTDQRLYYLDVDHKESMGGIIHSVGELASVNTGFYAGWRERDKKGNLVDMFGAWIPGEDYRAFSIAPIYGENELRESEPSYPDWVTDRYLQLPEDLPERIMDLARELTFSHTTPYDRAVAIERYLRSFPYTLDLPQRPAGVDTVDYFLFTLKKGYCDYYATSMVVLARAAGLPARFVSGFIGGTYDAENGYYIVTADQAHSWVEIYFPEHGWIAFEPTAGRPSIDRISELEDTPIEELAIGGGELESVEETNTPSYYSIIPKIIANTLLASVLGIVVWLFVDSRIMRYQTPVRVFAKLYHRLERAARKIDLDVIETYTPYEFSTALQERMSEIAETQLFARYLQSAPKELKWIIEQFILAAYSPKSPDIFARYRAIRTWEVLRWQFFLAALIVRFSSLKTQIENSLHRISRNRELILQGELEEG